MKKSIFVLLVLLAVLIVTCVYEKTYEIYSTSPKELTLIERKSSTQSDSAAANVPVTVEKKVEKTSAPVSAVPIVTKPVAVKPAPVVKSEPKVKTTTEMKVVPAEKPAIKTEKIVSKEVKKETTPSQKLPAVLTEEANVSKPAAIQKNTAVSTNKQTPEVEKSGEEEIVDYLMWALKNRDIAMKNRDEVEARIHELITKAINDRKIALADRKVVLDERSKNEVELEKLQTEQIDARDASYESITNPKTTNQGEK